MDFIPHFGVLQDLVANYATAHNFVLAKNSKQSFSEQQMKTYFPDTCIEKKIPYRGFFFCSPKSRKRSCEKCPFHLPFLFDTKTRSYRIQPQYVLHHNHEMESHVEMFGGMEIINYEGDLTPKESFLLENLSLSQE